MNFCPDCSNLLTKNIAAELVFTCGTCSKVRSGEAKDTLISRKHIYGEKKHNFTESILKNAVYGREFPRIHHKCKKCPRDILTYIRDQDLKRLVICVCGYTEYI
jgi:DNA-directed RNA polymerase subunit M/transcription elongation factor TFIIS